MVRWIRSIIIDDNVKTNTACCDLSKLSNKILTSNDKQVGRRQEAMEGLDTNTEENFLDFVSN